MQSWVPEVKPGNQKAWAFGTKETGLAQRTDVYKANFKHILLVIIKHRNKLEIILYAKSEHKKSTSNITWKLILRDEDKESGLELLPISIKF